MKRISECTSESVSEGHPDKIADQISDAILDACLAVDARSRVACEVLITTSDIVVAGEISSSLHVEQQVPDLVRGVIHDIGYADPAFGFDLSQNHIRTLLRQQSSDIAAAVLHNDGDLGAGDQGMMFGYAANETEQFMPLPIAMAHRLLLRHAELRKRDALPWLGPDAKSQVTVRYDGLQPVSVDTIVLSTQHLPDVVDERISREVREQIIEPVIAARFNRTKTRCLVNPSGRFVLGGPVADTGLTGRKIVADCYGGSCPHGGGSFSGKDPTKVDRSGAYAARYIAKNIVAAGLAQRCTVQIAYAIGRCDPVSLNLDLHDTGEVDQTRLLAVVRELFPLTPKAIIEHLRLLQPIYRQTSVYGHFGRDEPSFTWERIDKAETLRSAF